MVSDQPSTIPTRSQLLAGRRILVTGAAGAIGSAIADAVERHGAEPIRADQRVEGGGIEIDVTDEASVATAFDIAGRITDVVHSAGTLIVGPISATTIEAFRNAVEINLTGSFIVAREAARRLAAGSSVTMISSQAGFRAGSNWGIYCAVKAGVIRIAEALAQELGPFGIRVNSVCPGSVNSPMSRDALEKLASIQRRSPDAIRARNESLIPLGRYADAKEIGDVCVFLASPLASYVSGASIPIDGGEISA